MPKLASRGILRQSDSPDSHKTKKYHLEQMHKSSSAQTLETPSHSVLLPQLTHHSKLHIPDNIDTILHQDILSNKKVRMSNDGNVFKKHLMKAVEPRYQSSMEIQEN